MRRLLTALTLCAVAVLMLVVSPAQALVGEKFVYTGAEQTFTVPEGVHVLRMAAAGGSGGAAGTATGGDGAVVAGGALVDPGQTLYVEVGGNGQSQAEGGVGGFNGGGSAADGGGGGGASDVRTTPSAKGLSPDTRLIVGGGGGGAGGTGSEGFGGNGGGAGEAGETSEGGNGGGGPGTLVGGAGGSPGCGGLGEPGQLGLGGAGGPGVQGTNGGGGGGGGFYGGGGGGGGCGAGGGGGGGGSSLGLLGLGPQEHQVVIAFSKPPTIDIASPATGATVTQGQALTASYSCSSEEGITIEKCEGSVANGAALDTTTLGPHTLTVDAEDARKGTASESLTYTVVAPAPKSTSLLPETILSAHPKKTVKTKKKKAKVKFGFSSDVPGATFQCKLDKGAFAPCTSPKTYKVKKGKHTFSVEAVDPAGTDATPATFSFKVKKKT